MSLRGGALIAAVDAEISRHEQELQALRGVRAVAEQIFEGVEPPAPTPAELVAPAEPESTPEKRRRRREPSRRERGDSPLAVEILGVLRGADGPVPGPEIYGKLGVPQGNFSSTVRTLIRNGKVEEAGFVVTDRGRRAKAYVLPGETPQEQPEPEPNRREQERRKTPHGAEPVAASNGHDNGMVPELVAQVLELTAHKRLGDAGIAQELGVEIADVAPVLDDLLEQGDLVYDGTTYEAAP